MQPLTAPPRYGQSRPAPSVASLPMRDPAPSRWAYRMQRIMLTPHLRRLIRVGLPMLAVATCVGIYFSSETRRAAIIDTFVDLKEKFEHRPEFMVTLASIEGCSKELAEAVRARMDVNLPQSSFDLDLEAARARIEGLDAVKSAELRVRSGGVLQVIVTERQPVAIWRMDEGLTLVDDTGHRVASLISRGDRPDLPLIAGAGADKAAAEALQILAAAGPLAPRIRGLVRMGERRWDLVLDRDQRILLPTDNPVRAVERLLALDHAQDIVNRDLLTVDLRLPNRPTLRLSPYALTQLRSAQGVATVESDL
ncbi:cell division protein FtsQ/DivIB [Neotabrizicola sp. sgz301269]|uniref:cell division protein FtsQ/DivIB n=1 Tax=Neotabrizicola sp. sgz301269 TaxID=3276282 RepID=UPI00376F8C6F